MRPLGSRILTNRNFKQAFWASRKVPKNSPGGNRPISALNMRDFRLREGPHRSLCHGCCLGLPRIVAFEVRQRPRGSVGSGTEPDGSGSREGLRGRKNEARWLAVHLCRDVGGYSLSEIAIGYSLSEIAIYFGMRHVSGINRCVRKLRKTIEINEHLARAQKILTQNLTP